LPPWSCTDGSCIHSIAVSRLDAEARSERNKLSPNIDLPNRRDAMSISFSIKVNARVIFALVSLIVVLLR
jgi:hypothetical protein